MSLRAWRCFCRALCRIIERGFGVCVGGVGGGYVLFFLAVGFSGPSGGCDRVTFGWIEAGIGSAEYRLFEFGCSSIQEFPHCGSFMDKGWGSSGVRVSFMGEGAGLNLSEAMGK